MCARYYPSSKKNKGSPLPPSGDATIDENHLSRWLYNGLDGNWTKEDQERFERLYGVEGFRQYLDYLLDRRDRERIFDLYGIEYSNIHDPRNVKGARSGAALASYTLNFVSDNIKRLYSKYH